MGSFTDFLRKIGLLRVSKGDYTTGEYDNREDLKKEEKTEMPADDNQEPKQ